MIGQWFNQNFAQIPKHTTMLSEVSLYLQHLFRGVIQGIVLVVVSFEHKETLCKSEFKLLNIYNIACPQSKNERILSEMWSLNGCARVLMS